MSDEKIEALEGYDASALYTDAERAALRYTDAITLSDRDVSDEMFAELSRYYDADAIVELTATIAWENASAKFNRALRVPAQGLWLRERAGRSTA